MATMAAERFRRMFLQKMGQDVTYGTTVIKARVYGISTREVDTPQGLQQVASVRMRVSKSDVASPAIGDQVTINAVLYQVSAILESESIADTHTLELERMTAVEMTEPGYRR